MVEEPRINNYSLWVAGFVLLREEKIFFNLNITFKF